MAFHSNDVAFGFLAQVADEEGGRSRVSASIRAINFLRGLMGIPSLGDDPRTRMLSRGVNRVNPHVPNGAAPFPSFIVAAITFSSFIGICRIISTICPTTQSRHFFLRPRVFIILVPSLTPFYHPCSYFASLLPIPFLFVQIVLKLGISTYNLFL